MGLFAKKLGENQVKFKAVYAETGSVAEASRAVGRSRGWGYAEIAKPYMQEIVNSRIQEANEKTDLILDSALARKNWLMRVIMGEETCTQTFQGKDGPVEISSEFPPAIRAKCMELLMKVYGDFAPVKHEVTGGGITFVQVLNSRGPLPPGAEVKILPTGEGKLSIPETIYEQCPKCQESIEQKFLEKHVAGCPGV